MTDRLTALLTDMAEDAPRSPIADTVWRRAQRTRAHRRVAAGTAAVLIGAAVAIGGLPSVTSTTPAKPPQPDAPPAGGLPPLPSAIRQPIGEIPTLAERPTDRVLLTVQASLLKRTLFFPRQSTRCIDGRCFERIGYLAVGSDQGYRYFGELEEAGLNTANPLVSPSGEYVAMQLRTAREGNGYRDTWLIVDVDAGAAEAAQEAYCLAGHAGWTRDGRWVCITPGNSQASVALYQVHPGTVIEGEEFSWACCPESGPVTWGVTPELIGPGGQVTLGKVAAEPGSVVLINRAGEVIRTVRYPGATSVTPLRWCGPSSVLVEANGYPSVLGLDGVVRSRADRAWPSLGCRDDGSMLLEAPHAPVIRLVRPDGTVAGEIGLPVAGMANTSAPYITSFAIDAFGWQKTGRSTYVPGSGPSQWADEAALVLGALTGLAVLVGWGVIRGRRRRVAKARPYRP